MQILEEQDRRLLALPVGAHDGADGGVGAALQRLGSIAGSGRSGSGTPSKSKKIGRSLAQALVEQQQPPGDLLANRLRRVVLARIPK